MDLLARVEPVVTSIHPGASCVERRKTPIAGVLGEVAYQFLTPDYRVIYAWIAVSDAGEESVRVANGPPK